MTFRKNILFSHNYIQSFGFPKISNVNNKCFAVVTLKCKSHFTIKATAGDIFVPRTLLYNDLHVLLFLVRRTEQGFDRGERTSSGPSRHTERKTSSLAGLRCQGNLQNEPRGKGN